WSVMVLVSEVERRARAELLSTRGGRAFVARMRRRLHQRQVAEAAMIQVIAGVVDVATSTGTRPGPILIDEVIDAFAVEARPFLDREAENARRLIKAVNDSGANNEAVVGRLLDGLERVVRNWDRVAQPIHVSVRAR